MILTAMHVEAKAVRRALGAAEDVRVIGIGATSLPPVAEVQAPSTIILAGFAGALDPSLKVGDVVLDTTFPVPDLGFRRGRVYSSNTLVATAEAKHELWQRTGAVAVDMETEPVRALASAAGVPFIGLRTISDGAHQGIDPAILRFIDNTGGVRPLRLTVTLLRQPTLLRDLLQLGRSSRIAGDSLSNALRELFTAWMKMSAY